MDITMKRKSPRHGKNLGKLGSGGNQLKIIIRAGAGTRSIININRMVAAGINKLNRLALRDGDRRGAKNIAGHTNAGPAHGDESRRGLAKGFSRRQYQKKQNPAEELDRPISSAGAFHFIGR
jgi:hypothetical protein